MDAVFERESNLGQKVCGEREERKRRGRGEREDEEKAKKESSLSRRKKRLKFFRLPRPGKPRTPANAPEALHLDTSIHIHA
jgi:hypothetical protein